MGLDELRARLANLLANQGPSSDRRAYLSGLNAALVDFKVAASESRKSLVGAERELASETQQLSDAERRGRLAGEIGDVETARIAGEFAARHRERGGILERKIAVIREEIAYVEREYQALAAQYQSARQGLGTSGSSPAPEPALSDREFDLLKARADREATEAAVQAQLQHLKKKLNKE
jgi:multidrug resistance efflux pump